MKWLNGVLVMIMCFIINVCLQMANLWWITVTLSFFLSAGCLAQVNTTKLAPLIEKIKGLKNQ